MPPINYLPSSSTQPRGRYHFLHLTDQGGRTMEPREEGRDLLRTTEQWVVGQKFTLAA